MDACSEAPWLKHGLHITQQLHPLTLLQAGAVPPGNGQRLPLLDSAQDAAQRLDLNLVSLAQPVTRRRLCNNNSMCVPRDYRLHMKRRPSPARLQQSPAMLARLLAS